MAKRNLSEARCKTILKRVLLDQRARKVFLKDPTEFTGEIRLTKADKAALERIKVALPAFDRALNALAGTVLCAPSLGGCGGIA